MFEWVFRSIAKIPTDQLAYQPTNQGREETILLNSWRYRPCKVICRGSYRLKIYILPTLRCSNEYLGALQKLLYCPFLRKEETIRFFWISTIFWGCCLALVEITIYLIFLKTKRKSEALFMNHVTSYSLQWLMLLGLVSNLCLSMPNTQSIILASCSVKLPDDGRNSCGVV